MPSRREVTERRCGLPPSTWICAAAGSCAAREVIPLRPKTWAVLLYLAERPGALVTKDELFDALWPDVAVTPDTLNKSIGELRVALGDDSRPALHRDRAPARLSLHRRDARGRADPARARRLAVLRRAAGSRKRPFVGRDEELQLLADVLRGAGGRAADRLHHRRGRLGKTALVDAFLDSPAVRETTAPVWIGRAGCLEHHGPGEAYLPVLEALERLARPPRVERLVKLMRRAAPMWLAQMPWLSAGRCGGAAASLRGRAERMLRELAVSSRP